MLRGRLGLSIAALQLAAAGALGAATSVRGFGGHSYDPFKESWNMSRKERREMYRRRHRSQAGSKLARKAAKGQITIRKGW